MDGRELRLAALALVSSALVAACGGDGGSTLEAAPPPGGPTAPPTQAPPPSVQRLVTPETINSAVTEANEPHVVINPSPNVTATNKLFVFLPGTDGHPEMYEYIVQEGAARGYHTIGLNYPNPEVLGAPVPVGILCGNDTDCYYNVRNEIVTGENTSDLVSVDPTNSIVGRLKDAIAYLQSHYPDEGWGQYLKSDGSIDWSNVVLSGHSQGGGHVGVMVKKYGVNRACYFSSPPDWIDSTNTPAPWVNMPNVTAGSSQYAFAHVEDSLVPFDEVKVIWQAMGMGSSVVSVDGNTAPYGSSHTLSTDAAPNDNGGAVSPTHGAPVLDAVTPLTGSGKPLFAPVWDYLCFPQ